MGMIAKLAEGNPLGYSVSLLSPALQEMMEHAGSDVKRMSVQANYADDDLELAVVHRLFSRHELLDNVHTHTGAFRGRVARAILAEEMPNGRRLVIERRAFLARTARVRKSKPKKLVRVNHGKR